MTREEAIDELNGYIRCKVEGETAIKAIDMAIEALKQKPCDIDKYKAESDGAKVLENPTNTNCTSCILDGTDACSRGAGRAVDGRVCEDFIGESEE